MRRRRRGSGRRGLRQRQRRAERAQADGETKTQRSVLNYFLTSSLSSFSRTGSLL